YHFNWGWGGMSDGYFLLDALNPESVGTGGGEGGGYNSGQDIIIGIQPQSESSAPYVTQFGNLSASANGMVLNLLVNNGSGHWLNAGISAIKVNIGVEITPVGSTSAATQYVSFIKGGEIPALTLSGNQVSYNGFKGNASVNMPSILPNGTYKVTVCFQDANTVDAPWIPVCTTSGSYNFVYVTKNGSSCSVENFNETELSIVSAEPTTQVYYENACRFRLSVKNNSNLELSGGFYPVLYDGNTPAFLGEGITMTLAPGESDNMEFVTTFELLDGVAAPTETKEYTLRFSKNSNGSAFYNWSMPLSMGLLLRAPTFNTSNYCIEGAPTREETINGQTRTAYVVPDPSEIPFAATITNTGTFFGSPVYTLIYNSTLSGYNLTSLAMGPTAILDRGESATVKGSVDFSEAKDGEAYAAAIFYMNGGKLTQHTGSQILYFIVDSTASAVNEIEYDNTASDNEIYNLQGIPVGKDMNLLPAGIYIRNGKKILKRH
ncbi:MAG: hypothetical protein K2O56_04855, partial [Muribaculaceae bacterium]|nr:hypothetical protein [Muribaculaceae bacterium]